MNLLVQGEVSASKELKQFLSRRNAGKNHHKHFPNPLRDHVICRFNAFIDQVYEFNLTYIFDTRTRKNTETCDVNYLSGNEL